MEPERDPTPQTPSRPRLEGVNRLLFVRTRRQFNNRNADLRNCLCAPSTPFREHGFASANTARPAKRTKTPTDAKKIACWRLLILAD